MKRNLKISFGAFLMINVIALPYAISKQLGGYSFIESYLNVIAVCLALVVFFGLLAYGIYLILNNL